MISKLLRLSLAVVGICIVTETARAQVINSQRSYSDYYSNQLKTYRRPDVSPRRYTYDKYFYNRPSVSPYTNLVRANALGGTSYQSYVVPERRRRLQSAISQVPAGKRATWQTQIQGIQKSLGATSRPRPSTPGHYHNHWYGGRQAMGLSQ